MQVLIVLTTSVSDPYSSNLDLDPAKNLNPDSRSRKTLNLDPDPSYFFTISGKNEYYVNIMFISSKEVN